MKDFFGEDLCAAAARLTWRVCCQGRVGRRQAKQQRLPTKQLGGLELELNQAAHAQLPRLPSGAAMILARPTLPLPPSRLSATARAMQRWRPSSTRPLRTAMQWPTRSVPRQHWLSSMQRLPRARTRKQARRLRTLISRRTLPTMERGRRLAEKQLRLTSACFECHIESNFPLSSSRARKARNTFVRVYQK